MGGILDLTTMAAESALPAGLTVFVRGAALLLVALLVSTALRRAPAALRHHAWVMAMAGLVALPVLVSVAPEWRIAVPSSLTGLQGALAANEGRAGALGPAVATTSGAGEPASVLRSARGAGQAAEPGTGRSAGRAAPLVARDAATSAVAWGPILLGAWALGFVWLFGRLLTGILRATRLVRRARPVTDRGWNVLVSALSLKSGLDVDVRVVSSDEVGVPMAWGLTGAWLVLPEGIDGWPEERRRVVVLHELAHLRRRDCVSQALAQLALAIHWPNPLAWLAVRRMRSEREKACDDAVLAAGVGGPAYAHHLVDIARGISSTFRPARAAVAMARASELENRVLAILDPRRPRRSVGRHATRFGFLGLAVLLVPLATVRPASVPAAEAPVELATQEAGEGDANGAEASFEPKPPLDAETESKAEAESSPDPGRDADAVRRDRDEDEVMPRALSRTHVIPSSVAQSGSTASDTIEERVFRALVRALESEHADVRRQAAHTLGMIESPRGVEPLAALVRSDPDARVREQAAWALGMIESEAGVDALASATGDDDGSVREQVAWALGMIESARGVAPLLPLLDDESKSVRDQAAWALGMIESSEAVDGLTRAFASEGSADVRSQIVWALGMIEDRDAIDTVLDALEDPDAEVRDQAMWALGMILG